MKEIIKSYIMVALSALLVVFCIGYIWTGPIGNGNGLIESMGSIFENAEETDFKSEGYLLLKDVINAETPVVRYIGGTKQVGDIVAFKEMIEVSLSGENYKSGLEENGFYVYFKDIQDMDGNSVAISLDTEKVEALEEIPAAFVFDKEQEVLHFHKSGTFVMYIKIYTEDGIGTTYEFMIPVETS